MSRITLPEDKAPEGIDPGSFYVPEITSAANAYAYAVYSHSRLPLRVFEGARIATAVLNGCKICMNWRAARDIEKMGIADGVNQNGDAPDEAFYQSVLREDYSALEPRERLAIEYAKQMGAHPRDLSANDGFWQEMKAAFSEAEITDLTYCISMWMGLGRMTHVLGLDNGCEVKLD
ncbi:MAG: carboxymuconolactone decarboxylase family protein [Parvibaculales bacterium]